MQFQTLVIDRDAIRVLDGALIDDSWFGQFRLPENTEGIKRVAIGETIYLLSKDATDESQLLVMNIGATGVFSGPSRLRPVFDRILRVALRQFDRAITIPVQWKIFHLGSLLSVYADTFAKRNNRRICFDQSPLGSANIYAFAVTDGPEELNEVPIDHDAYRSAVSGFQEAALTEPPLDRTVGNFGILLGEPLGMQLAGQTSLDDWYERRLTPDQRRFVDQPTDRPIRLRGAAGTGKTQAMAVKCLRDVLADADKGGDKTTAFLTHSSALAHDIVRGMMFAMLPPDRLPILQPTENHPKLWIGTIYELAQQQLAYKKKGLRPLSQDGREGRQLQRFLIEGAIQLTVRDPRIVFGVMKQCTDLAKNLERTPITASLLEEIMNEFACTLDAENVRKGTPEAERYLSGSRQAWQMSLPTRAHRELILEIHDAYRTLLRKEKLLSMDQMIADFGRYLSTHEWTQLRDRDGFDYVYVDEYHYFTRAEAMTLQGLFKTRAEHTGRWPLFMAYDLKQSTTDTALDSNLERFRNPGVGESTPLDLKQVFRSTPQIAAFLRDLDGSFPAMDLEGEFDRYVGVSTRGDGEVPALIEFSTDTQLVDEVFARATKIGRELTGGGSQVAVLCLNEDIFDKYLSASRTQGKFVAVKSREDLRELRYAKSKCVFSMPEYVAGLQFDTVFLIHADEADLLDENLSQNTRRRYVSRVYLGASRASNKLIITSSKERGGPSEILHGPLQNKSLIKGLS